MTSDPGTSDPGTGGAGNAGAAPGTAVDATAADATAAGRTGPPVTGDGQVDSVLERLRAELGDIAIDDLTARRGVLADADAALRTLLDPPGSETGRDTHPTPDPSSDPSPGSGA